MVRIRNILLAKRPKEAIALEALLFSFANDRPSLEAALNLAVQSHKHAFKNGVALPLEMGLFHYNDLLAVLLTLQSLANPTEHTSIETLRLNAAIGNCIDLGMIGIVDVGGVQHYMLQSGIISMFIGPNVLDKAICGTFYHLDKYQNSVVPIIVKRTSGDQGIGTGFYFSTLSPSGIGWLITNKHVAVEDVDSIISMGPFARIEGEAIVEDPNYDICAIKVACSAPLPGLFFEKELILDEVIAVGFPNVAQTTHPSMLCHRGEINGRVRGYVERGRELLVVSCHVAPGNSGGPLLNKAGRVLGVVCQSKIGKSLAEIDGTSTIHHVAVPGDAMIAFTNQLV